MEAGEARQEGPHLPLPFSAAGCPPPTPLVIHDKDQRSPDAGESHQEERITGGIRASLFYK